MRIEPLYFIDSIQYSPMRFQNHVLNLDINIKQVFLKARPLSSLSFQMSADDKTVSLQKHKYSLDNDHCLVYEHCELQLQAQFDSNLQRYSPKQVFLQVFVEHDSGSSVVANIKFNPFEAAYQEKNWELSLQNSSPDARIIFSSKLTLISKKERLLKSGEISADDPYNMAKEKNEVKESKRFSKKSSANELIMPESKIKLKESYHFQKGQEVNRQINKTKKLESAKSIELNRNLGVNKAVSPKCSQQATQREKLYDEVEKLKRRIDEERAEKVRSISKLKVEANPKLLAGELPQSNNETARLKEKIRNLQRKQKSLQINIQDLLKELDKSKERQAHLEKRKQELQRAVAEKDIKLRAANSTIRALNEQIDALSSRQRIVSKKGEVKENIFKDQTKRLEDKLKQAELEVNTAVQQKNEAIKKIADVESKYQGMLKQKDQRMSEEKTKNFQLREQLISHQKQLENVVQDLNLENQEITKMNILNQEKIHQLEVVIARYQNETAELRQSLKTQKEKSNRLQLEYSKNQGQEALNQKKKYSQLSSQYQAASDRLRKYQNEIKEYEHRVKNLQQSLKAKTNDNQKHISRIQALQKELDSVKEEKNRKIVEIQHLKTTLATLQDKFKDLREKLQNQKNRREDANYDLQSNAAVFKQQRDALEAQINQYKWGSIKNNDIINQLEFKIKGLNQEMMKLTEQIMLKAQRIVTLQENNKALGIQNQHLEKDNQTLQLKIRQVGEKIKQKQMQLEEEIKKKQRLQHKYEEEKQRVNQLELSFKNRQGVEEKKQKEKDELVKIKTQELAHFEIELCKKNQEVLALKANIDVAMRQIQLAKNDYESAKNELIILRADHHSLKDQLQDQQSKCERLSSQLGTANDKLAMQIKRYELLKVQHEDYRRGIQASFQNLAGQFFKDEPSNNIIATTLIPFPDQSLSALQIQLVQKRNNFFIKQRQINTTYEHQIASLQNQLKELKQLFERRENELKNSQNQEKQNLKGLLYEGMLEKNNLAEEINTLNQERQGLLRDIQRLRREIIGKEQHEEELNGQLQILLFQHDSLKTQNQDLSNLIFKYREEEIKMRGEYEKKQIQLQEENRRAQERNTMDLIDKDRRIVVLEKQLMQQNEKRKATEAEKGKLKEQVQSQSQKAKEAEFKLSNAESEVTKLNNNIRNYEKSEVQLKQILDKLQNQLKKYQFKEETLSVSISNLQAELTQSNIERQRLNGEVLHLRERLQETQRVLGEKGEISKERISKKMEENGQLKAKLIQKESQLSLKEFYLSQKEQQILALTQEKEQHKNTIAAFKSKIKELNQLSAANQGRLRQYTRELERLDAELRKTEQMLAQSNFNLITMQSQLQLKESLEDQLREKQNECLKLREQKAENNHSLLQQIKQCQEKIAKLKGQLEGERNVAKSMKDEHRVSISRAQSSNTEKYNTLLFELQQERDEFEKRVAQIQSHNKSVMGEFESKIEQLRLQILDYQDNQKLLKEEITKRDSLLTSLKKKYADTEQALDEIKQKYNRYYLLYEQSRGQIQQMIRSQEEKTVKIMKNAHSNMIRSLNHKLSELSRNIERFKYSIETSPKKDTYSRKQFLAEFHHIFSKLREYLLLSEQKESDSMEVKNQRALYQH